MFLLIARLFSMLVLDDVTIVALAINTMSAIFSALTVFITYHLIYRFADKHERRKSKVIQHYSDFFRVVW